MDKNMIKATINGTEISVEPGTTIMEAAKQVQVKIPTLCSHPDLPATASCGICVVKIKGAANMPRACSTPVADGMDITTHDPEILKVRRTVLELILSAHPNECLTCGRNGTCELQALAEEFGIRRETLPQIVADLPIDDTTKTIVLEPRKCIKCGRCLEVCQNTQDVWALSFLERSLNTRISPAGDISLADSPCIRCGQCSAHCPVGAIYEYDDTDVIWKALVDPDCYCVAQIAPAVRVSLGESYGFDKGQNIAGQIYDALKRMGFDAVFDTNFGADVTIMEEATEFVQRFTQAGQLPLITTCCPAWVDFMEKFHGDMIDSFSSCKSPHAIVGTLAKTYYAQENNIDPKKIFMVSIMPCTAKKYEITRTDSMFASGMQDVDVSITTREFSRMIKQSGIDLHEMNADVNPDSILGSYSGAGTIFGASGGVMEAALRTASYLITGQPSDTLEFQEIRGPKGVKTMNIEIAGKNINIAVAHGVKNVKEVLNAIRLAKQNNQPSPYDFVEVMACPGGCVGGGGQAWHISDDIRDIRSQGLYAEDRSKDIRTSYENLEVKKLYSDFLGKPLSKKSHDLLHTKYTSRPQYKK